MGPRTIVTAAHCLHNGSSFTALPDLQFGVSDLHGQEPFERIVGDPSPGETTTSACYSYVWADHAEPLPGDILPGQEYFMVGVNTGQRDWWLPYDWGDRNFGVDLHSGWLNWFSDFGGLELENDGPPPCDLVCEGGGCYCNNWIGI